MESYFNYDFLQKQNKDLVGSYVGPDKYQRYLTEILKKNVNKIKFISVGSVYSLIFVKKFGLCAAHSSACDIF